MAYSRGSTYSLRVVHIRAADPHTLVRDPDPALVLDDICNMETGPSPSTVRKFLR